MIDEDIILNAFPIEDYKWHLPDKIKAGIFTNDADKAEKILNQIYADNKDNVIQYVNGRDRKDIMLNDGTWYVWIKPILNSRGHRCRKAYIDRNIDIDTLQELIIPICLLCTRKDIIVI